MCNTMNHKVEQTSMFLVCAQPYHFSAGGAGVCMAAVGEYDKANNANVVGAEEMSILLLL